MIRTRLRFTLAIFAFSLTLGLHGASVTITPANPTMSVGQTLQLTANGAVTPTAIATGYWHTCVLYSDQSVRCAGLNSQGELGNNDSTFSRQFSPVLVSGPANPVRIRTGAEHTCALIGDGTMQCWGSNYTGQLGDGTMGGFALVPQPVHGITNALDALTGGYFTCAILPDHTVQCWGRNQDGQLGNGQSTTDEPLPAPVMNLGPVAALSAGGYHACALLSDGTAQCWGRNARGQVGDGNQTTPVTVPTPVSGLTNAVQVAAGFYHTCARLADGTVQCWGQNDYGQIGSNSPGLSMVPLTVSGIAGAIAVSPGFYHTCAIQSDGSLWCWGRNDFGELGNGTTTSSFTPTQVPGLVNPIAVAAGGFHTCTLMPDFSVQCWGENDYGELGNGTGTNSPTPVKMNGTGLTWTSSNTSVETVSATGLATAVGTGTTTITATDPFGNSGTATLTVTQQLTLTVMKQGDGTGSVTSSPAGITCGTVCSSSNYAANTAITLTASPDLNSTFSGWTGCDSVSGATCTVTMSADRSVAAIFTLQRLTLTVGKTGNGTVTSSPAGITCGTACASDYAINTVITLTATPGSDSTFTGWTGCDSVSGATCTVTMSAARSATATFTLQSATLTVGKTGTGTGTVTSSPAGITCGTTCASSYVINTAVTLTAAPDPGSTFSGWTGCDSVSGATCSVSMTAARSVRLTLMLRVASATITPANPAMSVGQTVQLTANGVVTPTAIASGYWHTCVLYSDQSVRCTGLNSQGELGNNDSTFSRQFSPVLVSGPANPVRIRTGAEHTCALIGDGTMQCWGSNYTGQLGDGTMGGFALVPQPVHGITNALDALTGGYFTCAILPDHTVQCWGRNQDGQLGNGQSTTDEPLPAPVMNLGPVAALSAGGYHACALLSDGTAQCWGRNARGQVGDGNQTTPVTVPTPVSGLTNAVQVAAGFYHTCARLADGTVQCWGQNDYGQIGSNSPGLSMVPLTVSGIAGAIAVSPGFYHTCAIQSDGSLWCWGRNDFGELGNGTTTSSFTPTQVPGLVNPIAVAAGGFHTCALMPDFSVQCWGENDYGELGNGTGTNSPTPVKMNGTGLTWTSSAPSVATVTAGGLATAVGSGTATITVTDPFGNSGTTTLTVGQVATLTVMPQGTGSGSVSSSPVGIICGATCSAPYASGTTVTLTATPSTGSVFTGWAGCDAASGATCTVTMGAARSVSATFAIPVAPPTFSPAGGTYTGSVAVTLGDGTSGATIYYTTDGSTPTTASSVYGGPITLTQTTTLNALAAAGGTTSGVASATYTIPQQVATPTVSPAGGTYTGSVTVTIGDATAGVTIYYTTDGSTPTTASSVSGGPLTLTQTATLKTMAAASGMTGSAVASAAYTIQQQVATPTFSPAGGTYTGSVAVTMSDATAGVTFYYTTDGSTPTTASSVYSGPITFTQTTTARAMAAASGMTSSAVASATYTIQQPVPIPTFSPAGGTYTASVAVTMSDATAGVTIYYTTDGSTPTTASSVYGGPLTLTQTTPLKAMAAASGMTSSSVASAAYTIQQQVATPTVSPAGGTYTGSVTVTLGDGTSGATIYYTTDGSTPTTGSSVYGGPIRLTQTTVLKAMAAASGMTSSAVASAAYTIQQQVATPTVSPAGGTYTGSVTVTLGDGTSGATIYYTTDGSTPTTGSSVYGGPIRLTQTTVLKAMAAASGMTSSAVASAAYTIQQQVATPTVSPAGGTYTGSVTVTLGDGTSGATIYYTTDGSTPTTGSSVYGGPIRLTQTTVLKAMAAASGMTSSAVASAAYTIQQQVATPTVSPAGGTYTGSVAVTLGDGTSGATIYYTTDGSTPTTGSSVYGGPIRLTQTTVLKAMAAASGMTSSALASAAYTIQQQVATPTVSPASGTYTGSVAVTIGDATAGATIYYTTDGSTPTTSSAVYTGPVSVTQTTTIRAMAAASGMASSAVAGASYTLKTATPTFNPPGGTYILNLTVSILDVTPGATIYYTTDGSTPTTSSPVYRSPILLAPLTTTTIKAIAVAPGQSPSTAASVTYTVVL